MKIDGLALVYGFIGIVYLWLGLSTYTGSLTVEDWRIQFVRLSIAVGLGFTIMLVSRIYKLHKKSRKVKEDQDDDP